MPVGGSRQTTKIGGSYDRDPLYGFAKSFCETATDIVNEHGFDIFEEPSKVLRRAGSKEAMKRFFVENSFDANNDSLSPMEIEDHIKCMEEQFQNDVEAMNEHAVMADYNPMVGMALPIHKLILMNMVFDKGAIQKVTAVQPKFTLSLERRILVAPDGKEIDMFTQQNEMTAAINSTAPFQEVEITLPEIETTDVLAAVGGTSIDSLITSTTISAVMVPDCVYEAGDILPGADGFAGGGVAATVKTTVDTWFKTNIKFAPNYGSGNHYDRTVVQPISIVVKKEDVPGTVKKVTLKDSISGSMNDNKFTVSTAAGKVTKVKIRTRLDASNGMLDTCSVKWKVDTDLVEIDTSIPINTTISPEEVKDLSAMYNVNQLTKLMSLFKTAMANFKDDSIKGELDASYDRMDARSKSLNTFDFAPRDGYALDHVEWRSKTFMDFLDNEVTSLLQVLNDPNMTITVVGDPQVVRKITPKEYTYVAPSAIGPVELDYTQTVVNGSDKRVYQFLGSDKMRHTNQLMILLNPRNTDRVIYRIYDYQMYVSNEIRNAKNHALPALHAFERWKFVDYQPVQGRVNILNPSGLRA